MSRNREDIEYERLFGNIPNDQLQRIAYILGKKTNNKKYNEMIRNEANKIKRMKWNVVEFTMYKIPKPSARPRANSQGGYIHMYVPRAGENGKWFENFYKTSDLPFISTPCKLDIEIYEKTPTYLSMKNKVLAELGLIRPWKRTGDFDNYAKSVADMMQHGMLEDDSLVVESTQKLFYSIKPRIYVKVAYMKSFPEY